MGGVRGELWCWIRWKVWARCRRRCVSAVLNLSNLIKPIKSLDIVGSSLLGSSLPELPRTVLAWGSRRAPKPAKEQVGALVAT